MRGLLAGASSDRISSFAVLTAGLLCGVSVFFVALPLAQSSPFPTPKDGGWISEAPRSYQLASAAMFSPVTLPEGDAKTGGELSEVLGVQAAIEWEALTAPAGAVDHRSDRSLAGARARRRARSARARRVRREMRS